MKAVARKILPFEKSDALAYTLYLFSDANDCVYGRRILAGQRRTHPDHFGCLDRDCSSVGPRKALFSVVHRERDIS